MTTSAAVATRYVPPQPVACDEAPPVGLFRVRGHVPEPGEVLVDATGRSHMGLEVRQAPTGRAETRRGIRRVLVRCDTTTLDVRVDRLSPLVLATAS